jgi:hypothetical protein
MVLVHAEGYVPHFEVEKLLWNVQPLCCVNKPVVKLGERRVVEG